MRSDPIRAVVVAALFAAGCPGSSSSEAVPHPTGVVPNVGYSTVATPLEISGSEFLASATQSSSGGTPTIDTHHRAWLGDVELSGVTWVSTTKLTATAPAGLPLGALKLTVENALGERGTLDAAFTVLPAPSFAATVAVSRASVNVGQTFTLTLTVANNGSANVVSFALGAPTLTLTGGAQVALSGSAPSAPATLAAGARQTFTWTYQAKKAGRLTATVSATGQDAVSGAALTATPPAPAQIAIQNPAALSAVMIVPPSVAKSTAFQVSMKVTNNGDATATAVTPGALTVTSTDNPPATASFASGPTPPSASIAGGGSQTFVWTYTAGTSLGHLQIGGSVSGTDANSGASLAATASPLTALVANAAIIVTIQPGAPASVLAGQSFSVVVRFEDTGTANVTDFVVAAPTFSSPYPSTVCGAGPTTTPPTSLLAGQHVDLTWNCSPAVAGELKITFAAGGTDSSGGFNMHIDGSAPLTVTVTAATLSVTKSGTGTVTCNSGSGATACAATATYPYGTVVTLAAAPDLGSSFTGWGGDCSGAGSCSVTMNASHSVTATFTLTTNAVTVTKNGSGTGSVTCNSGSGPGPCAATYPYGTTLTLAAAADTGSTFTGWGGDCSGSGTGSSCVLTNIASPKTVTATFTLTTNTVTVHTSGSGTVTSAPTGITSCAGTCSAPFNYGSTVTLSATPGTGYSFTGWSGACTGTDSCVFINVTSPKDATATFTLTTNTVTVTNAGTGSGTVSSTPSGISCGATCSANFSYGSDVTLSATPGTGSSFTGWGGACSGTGSCTLTNITSAKTVTATFKGTAATPTFNPAPGAIASGSSVAINDATTGAEIRYTVNGDTPTASSTLYTGAITVSPPITIKAIAIASGYSDSAVASGAYTIPIVQ